MVYNSQEVKKTERREYIAEKEIYKERHTEYNSYKKEESRKRVLLHNAYTLNWNITPNIF